jgi:hypothetical protein
MKVCQTVFISFVTNNPHVVIFELPFPTEAETNEDAN